MLKEIGRWLPDQLLPLDQKFQSSQKKPSPLSEYIGCAKRFYFLLQPQHIFNNFLQYVVFGNQKKAEATLNAYPQLLSLLLQQKGLVIDYSGRTIYGAALQIALGAEDVKYHDDEECMAEMLMRYLKQLPNGAAIIQQQIAEQFPDGWEEQEKERAKRDLAALKKVVGAYVSYSQDGDNCDADIQAFQKYLDDENKSIGVIKTGKHFNVQLLVDVFNLHAEKYNQFGVWWVIGPISISFWRTIIRSIERYFPACYAQVLCQGVDVIVNAREKLSRRMTLRYWPKVAFFPLDSDPEFQLGQEYGGASMWGPMGAPHCFPLWVADNLQTISNKKQERCVNYVTAAKKSLCELPYRDDSMPGFLCNS
jgi:hypothetical protein